MTSPQIERILERIDARLAELYIEQAKLEAAKSLLKREIHPEITRLRPRRPPRRSY
jgi:hypothetical protein